jgi:hypothetical protein
MSPRAACRLATLGFAEVYGYAAGKVDRPARNLPVEGTDAGTSTIGRYLRHDVITACLDESIADVRARVAGSPYRFALVTTAKGTLLGRLRSSALDSADDGLPVSEAMEPGPSSCAPMSPRPRPDPT